MPKASTLLCFPPFFPFVAVFPPATLAVFPLTFVAGFLACPVLGDAVADFSPDFALSFVCFAAVRAAVYAVLAIFFAARDCFSDIVASCTRGLY